MVWTVIPKETNGFIDFPGPGSGLLFLRKPIDLLFFPGGVRTVIPKETCGFIDFPGRGSKETYGFIEFPGRGGGGGVVGTVIPKKIYRFVIFQGRGPNPMCTHPSVSAYGFVHMQ